MNEKINTISLAVIALSLVILVVLEYSGSDSKPAPAKRSLSPDATPTAPITRGQLTPNSPPGGQPSISAQNPVGDEQPVENATVMDINGPLKDFGDVKAGEKMRHTFEIANTGSFPLTMSGISADAGATLISTPTEPIPVGGRGKIEVELNTAGLSGPQTLNVHVNANTEPSHQHLTLQVNVK